MKKQRNPMLAYQTRRLRLLAHGGRGQYQTWAVRWKRITSSSNCQGTRCPNPMPLLGPPRRCRIRWIKAEKRPRYHSPIEHRITKVGMKQPVTFAVALSRVIEIGEQAVAAVAASLAGNGTVVRGQLI